MKRKNIENEVYFLGPQQRKPLYKYVVGILFVLTAICLAVYYFSNCQNGPYHQKLPEVVALPKEAVAPKFDGKYDFAKFFEWFSEHLEYPKEYETIDAKVVVSFVITQDGTIDDISIVSQPKQAVFANEVVKLLRKCPKWEPGKLADGTKISISYTLPVTFNKTKRFEQ